MKRILSLLMACAMVLALAACGNNSEPQETPANSPAGENTGSPAPAESPEAEPVELIVFAAASMTETLTAISDLYAQVAPHVTLTFNFDSSGKLVDQIEAGADCDIFISAAQKQMNEIDGSLGTDVNPDGYDFVLHYSSTSLISNTGPSLHTRALWPSLFLQAHTRQAPMPQPMRSSKETRHFVVMPHSLSADLSARSITGGPQEIIRSASVFL